MSNPNEHTNYRREVRQESHNDINGNTHVSKTSETVNNTPPNAYQDGYAQGRVSENHYQQEVLTERDNENASRGLLLGILLTSLAALTAGALWFLNQKQEVEPVTQTDIVVPAPSTKPSPVQSKAPEKQTTVIEKTKEVPLPVVIPQAPAPQAPASAPDINITLPSPASQAPATETTKESKSTTSSTTVTPTTQSPDSSATPSESTTSNTTSSTSTSKSEGATTGN